MKYKDEYTARINRVLDYIDKNIGKQFTLEELSSVANFSQFHFHRIFSACIGEPLGQFIQRLQIEKAATKLYEQKDKSVTEVLYDLGYSSSSSFARKFKEFFNMSATEWRNGGYLEYSKTGKMNSKNCKVYSNWRQDLFVSSMYFDDVNKNYCWRIKMTNKLETKVEVRDMQDMNVAYVRNIGPYAGNTALFAEMFGKLCKWAHPRGLVNEKSIFMSVYHDNPDITDEQKLRLSVCLTVPKNTETSGEIGNMLIEGGKYACARFEINENQYAEAWNLVYGGWLPESGYQCDDKPCFELYLNDPQTHPEKKHIFEICIPVKPM